MKPVATDTVRVTEVFHSIQGESSHAGKPCAFVRLTGCSRRCRWCDTSYAFAGGQEMTIGQVLEQISEFPARLVEITGGEPLEQEGVYPLMETLLGRGFTVMLETGGHVPLDHVPTEVIKVIDVKCPDSGECGTFVEQTLAVATNLDEFKFVIASRRDYEWAREFFKRHLSEKPNTALFSPAYGLLPPRELSEWVLSDGLDVRVQLQIHKHIWDPDTRAV